MPFASVAGNARPGSPPRYELLRITQITRTMSRIRSRRGGGMRSRLVRPGVPGRPREELLEEPADSVGDLSSAVRISPAPP